MLRVILGAHPIVGLYLRLTPFYEASHFEIRFLAIRGVFTYALDSRERGGFSTRHQRGEH